MLDPKFKSEQFFNPEEEQPEVVPHEYAVARAVATHLQSEGFESYIVGGAVRDLLLGHPPKDFDLATNAEPTQVLELFSRSKYTDAAQAYGVTRVKVEFALDNEPTAPHELEIATFRRDISAHLGRRQTKVEFADLAEDVIRRDFTINALALDPVSNQLIDYVGGIEDIATKQLRFVGNPLERIKEDPLRIMRAIRFRNRLGFKYEEQTEQALFRAVEEGYIEKISPDRIRNELSVMLIHSNRRQAILDLEKLGILQKILPEFTKLKGVEQSANVHAEGDVWQHSLLVLENLTTSPDLPYITPTLAWATLLHDIGKPVTRGEGKGGRITFYDHDTIGAKIATEIAKRFHFSNKEIQKIYWLVEQHMKIKKLVEMKKSNQLELAKHSAIYELLALNRADDKGSWKKLVDGTIIEGHGGIDEIDRLVKQILEENKNQPASLKEALGIDGKWIIENLNVEPGPVVGRALDFVKDLYFEQGISDHNAILKSLRSRYTNR